MAEIVLGIGTSHTPLLSLPPEMWPTYAEGDKRNPELLAPPQGELVSYDELLGRADPSWARQATAENFFAAYDRCQKALAALEQTLAETAPDVVVIISDDQDELFFDNNMPSLAIYWGETIPLIPWRLPETAPAHVKAFVWGYGDVELDVPVDAGLGKHLVEYLIDVDFDVAHSRYVEEEHGGTIGPAGYVAEPRVTKKRRYGLPHGFAFVVRRLMNGKVVPIVPVFQNTCYPPNQPTPKRCYAFGKALRAGIEAWESDKRVAIIGSGGLSHFVVDEELDRMLLRGMQEKNGEILSSLPRERLNSAASEIRNWVTAAGALEHLDMRLIDYVPVRRTPAGTGGGWCFATWS